jgi:carboxypeptidase PM20D1
MNWIFPVLGIPVCAAAVTAVIRTLHLQPPDKPTNVPYIESADPAGAEKLAQAIRIPTISYMDTDRTDYSTFLRFQELLQARFPLIHQYCEKIVVNQYSLIYCLKAGYEPAGLPILITAHQDVVPVEPGTENDWTEPPFSGTIRDGVLWGRGALDIKIHLIAAMEALERLLQKGFLPKRDIYLAFGHDEEIGGQEGAQRIAEHFKRQGLRFAFVLDEGGCIAANVLPGIETPIAFVGVGEKGYANIQLSVAKDGGHSSMPSPHTSLGILAKAICRMERHPFKPRLIAPSKAFLLRIGPHMKGLNRLILANLWLFQPVFLRVFSKTKAGNALLRTTMAVTMAQGSPAPNVVPQKSTAIVNCRILPGDDEESVLSHFRTVLKGLPVSVKPLYFDEPSSISASSSDSFFQIEETIKAICPEVIVAPYLVMAGTDAKKYEPVADGVYRFSPYLIDNADLAKIHATNESISVVNVNRCIDFFMALMEKL